MAITSFVPKLWAARLLSNLEKNHVALAFVNRDYEGEIKKMGDTVHINSLGAITVKDYTDGTAIDAPQGLTTNDQTLVIDKAKYFNFKVSDIEKVQAAGDLMDKAMNEASYAVADAVDTAIFATMATAATSVVTGALSASNVYDAVVAFRTAMVNAKVPKGTWKLAVNPTVMAYLLKDDRFVKAGTDKQNANLENGFVGRVAGFDIYETLSLPEGVNMLGSYAGATTFAEQIAEIEAYRPENTFADAVKGLDLYGVKVVRASCVFKDVVTATANNNDTQGQS